MSKSLPSLWQCGAARQVERRVYASAYGVTMNRGHMLFAQMQYISRDLGEVKEKKPSPFEAWVNEFYGATKPSPDKGIDGIMLDGTPIQTKTYLIKYDKVGQFHSDTKHHPCVAQPVKRIVMVSQVGFDDSARQRKAEIESKENVRVELITLEDMLPNQGGATKDR